MAFDFPEHIGRVCEVWSDSGGGNRGTGYLLGDGLILTALHVLWRDGDAVATTIKARPLLIAEEVGGLQLADLVWPPRHEVSAQSPDAALIRLRGTECPLKDPLEMGPPNIAPHCFDVPIHAIGFPAFTAPEGGRHDVEQISGIAPLATSIVRYRYQIAQLVDAQRRAVDETLNWSGMSGAALLSEGRLIGVLLARASANQRYEFSGLRIERLLKDPLFATAVADFLPEALRPKPAPQVAPPTSAPAGDPFAAPPRGGGPFGNMLGFGLGTRPPGASERPAQPDSAFIKRDRKPRVEPDPPPPIGAPVLAAYWDRLDKRLQDAFALAATDVRRKGKDWVSTASLFAALHRLTPAPLPAYIAALPDGALDAPTPEDVPIDYAKLAELTGLSPCVTDSLHKLAPKVGQLGVLASEDMFLDISRHGKGTSTARLRAHGITADWVADKTEALGWDVLKREEA